jgi:hypothetical protein
VKTPPDAVFAGDPAEVLQALLDDYRIQKAKAAKADEMEKRLADQQAKLELAREALGL